MTPNRERMAEIKRHTHGRMPKYLPGTDVLIPCCFTLEGVVDTIYGDYESAVSSFVVKPGWYEGQCPRPKTPKSGFWYGIVLDKGAMLVGEDDLELAK